MGAMKPILNLWRKVIPSTNSRSWSLGWLTRGLPAYLHGRMLLSRAQEVVRSPLSVLSHDTTKGSIRRNLEEYLFCSKPRAVSAPKGMGLIINISHSPSVATEDASGSIAQPDSPFCRLYTSPPRRKPESVPVTTKTDQMPPATPKIGTNGNAPPNAPKLEPPANSGQIPPPNAREPALAPSAPQANHANHAASPSNGADQQQAPSTRPKGIPQAAGPTNRGSRRDKRTPSQFSHPTKGNRPATGPARVQTSRTDRPPLRPTARLPSQESAGSQRSWTTRSPEEADNSATRTPNSAVEESRRKSADQSADKNRLQCARYPAVRKRPSIAVVDTS